MSEDEINRLSGDEIQEYIFTHRHVDENKILLKHSDILGLSSKLVVQQIAARKKAEIKLPFFYKTRGIIYPPTLNLEQCSSESTAKFKCDLIGKNIAGKIKAADLTGGFGIDSFFIAQIAQSLHVVEPDSELIRIAQHNHSLLGQKNITYQNSTVEIFLSKLKENFNLIFIDPSRRDSKARKVFSFSDCSPDVPALLPSLFEKTDYILIKASPLLDIQHSIKELKCVKKVIIVSVENECKDQLFLLQKDFSGEPLIETYNLRVDGSIKDSFVFLLPDEQRATTQFSSPKKYLYEPNASILKSGAFKLIGEKFDLFKIHINTHFYTSDKLHQNFPGRIFEIKSLAFDANLLPEKKANVVTRNYPLSPEALKKKLKLTDGGEKFVIAFSGQEKKYVTVGSRIK